MPPPKAGLIEYRTVQLLAREGIAGPSWKFTAGTGHPQGVAQAGDERCLARAIQAATVSAGAGQHA